MRVTHLLTLESTGLRRFACRRIRNKERQLTFTADPWQVTCDPCRLCCEMVAARFLAGLSPAVRERLMVEADHKLEAGQPVEVYNLALKTGLVVRFFHRDGKERLLDHTFLCAAEKLGALIFAGTCRLYITDPGDEITIDIMAPSLYARSKPRYSSSWVVREVIQHLALPWLKNVLGERDVLPEEASTTMLAFYLSALTNRTPKEMTT